MQGSSSSTGVRCNVLDSSCGMSNACSLSTDGYSPPSLPHVTPKEHQTVHVCPDQRLQAHSRSSAGDKVAATGTGILERGRWDVCVPGENESRPKQHNQVHAFCSSPHGHQVCQDFKRHEEGQCAYDGTRDDSGNDGALRLGVDTRLWADIACTYILQTGFRWLQRLHSVPIVRCLYI
jgi:hypothetical protein